MSRVFVAGVSMTPFGKFLGKSVKQFTYEAVQGALTDSAIERSQIECAFFSNTSQATMEGQIMIPGQVALRAMGLDRIPVANVENACASASTAFHLAYAQIKAGLAGVALAVGAEKMYHQDRAKSFALFDGAIDVSMRDELILQLRELNQQVDGDLGSKSDGSLRSVFMDVYAALAKHHMKAFGLTERQLAAVAAKNHRHSTMNPLSQYQNDMSIEQILSARMISWPLTLPMCAPISDGAAAAVLCSEEALKRIGIGTNRVIEVKASVLVTGSDRAANDLDNHVSRRAALKAYEAAGVGPEDMSVAEVHDASAFAEVLHVENLGFCSRGEGGAFSESGATALGGRIPTNPSGGLISKGHPIGATGLGQIFELVTQLRGEAGPRQVDGARLAIAENGGGFHGYEEAVVCSTVLGRA